MALPPESFLSLEGCRRQRQIKLSFDIYNFFKPLFQGFLNGLASFFNILQEISFEPLVPRMILLGRFVSDKYSNSIKYRNYWVTQVSKCVLLRKIMIVILINT